MVRNVDEPTAKPRSSAQTGGSDSRTGERIDLPRGSVRVMVIDDEPTNIKVVCRYLETAGYRQFITTSESPKALDLIRDQRPDVVLLDVMMPHVDGLAILEAVRADPALRYLP